MPAHLECLAVAAHGLSQALLGSSHFILPRFQLLPEGRVALQHLSHLSLQRLILFMVGLQHPNVTKACVIENTYSPVKVHRAISITNNNHSKNDSSITNYDDDNTNNDENHSCLTASMTIWVSMM